MRPYFQLSFQEPPDVSHQTPQNILILVSGEWYFNFIWTQNWPRITTNDRFIACLFFNEHQKSMVGQTLMYVQHRHMVYGKFHICHDLDLDQNVYDNAYPTLLLHDALDVNHKMVMLGVGWYRNTFHIFACNISIILNIILSVCPFSFIGSFTVFPLINDYMFMIILLKM